ncbi:MAG: type IV secretory system conjugative DNA transfer family protein [Nitrospiraceae bacterium]
MRTDTRDLIIEIRNIDQQTATPLGTAQWMGASEAAARLRMDPDTPSDRIWLGEACEGARVPLGYGDDRHVCLISGTRGGKGTGLIVPNLCVWPGSSIIIDPKGENATVTAQRRGNGSSYARGLGQAVQILDPFGEVQLDPGLRARFNPLDVIDPEGDLAVDDAARIAAAIIVRENQNDPFFEEAARALLKGLILFVLTSPSFKEKRNLVSVRRLAMQGHWIAAALLRQAGEEKPPPPFSLLWNAMAGSSAYNGVVAGVGQQMLSMADRTRSSVLETLRTNTAFIDSTPMQRLLEASDFDLTALKSDPKGLTIYLTLPQRYMDTHFRWLRLMVSLAVGEMERIKGRPQTGYPTLFLLDEFAGLKRMEVIENAVAQAAGFGVKFFFVLQNLPQLKDEYKDDWESFVSNSGLKIFFQIDDHFTRDYVSNLLGEREVRRQSQSGSQALSDSTSSTTGRSETRTDGVSDTLSSGKSKSYSHQGTPLFWRVGQTWQEGDNDSKSVARSESDAFGASISRSDSRSTSTTDSWSEAIHKRPLLNPDELGRFFARVDDPVHPAYPGLLLAVMPGKHPLVARRINYFQSSYFTGLFDPHPDHPPPPTLAERNRSSWDTEPIRKLSLDPWDPPATQVEEAEAVELRPGMMARIGRALSIYLFGEGSTAAPHPAAQPTAIVPAPPETSSVARAVVEAPPLPALPEEPLLPPRQNRNAARPKRSLFVQITNTILIFLMLMIALVIVTGTVAIYFRTTGDRMAATSNKPATSAAFQDGLRDRSNWERWFSTLSGDAREGANFWAGERSKSNPGSCYGGKGQWSVEYRKFCIGAKDFLDKVDARRRSESEYWRGWNNY